MTAPQPADQRPRYEPPPGQGGWQQPPPPQWGATPPSQPGPYPPPYGVSRPTNGLAVASMVLGIVWLWWIGSVLALVFGYVAKRQIAERSEAGDGMATAGIVLGWIGVGTFALFFVLPFLGLFSFGL